MKTIEETAKEYAKPFRGYDDGEAPARDVEDAFTAGVEFAQQWIPVEEELPNYGEQVLVKNKVRGIHTDIFYSKFSNNITHWRRIELK